MNVKVGIALSLKHHGSALLTVTCSKCGHQLQETLRRLYADRDVECPSCGETIRVDLQDTPQFVRGDRIDGPCD